MIYHVLSWFIRQQIVMYPDFPTTNGDLMGSNYGNAREMIDINQDSIDIYYL